MAYDFIPKGEIWIDASYDIAQRKYIVFHELVEWSLMSRQGYSYESAHHEANAVERLVRKQLHSESKAEKLINSLLG